MPFCTHCGTQVRESSAYCAHCGTRQPDSAAPPPTTSRSTGEDWMNGISRETASTVCYVPFVGWVAGLIFLASQKFRQDRLVRFHSFQGLYLFVFWLLIDFALIPVFGGAGFVARRAITGTMKLAIVGTWVYMLVKTAGRETVRLPFLGELADRSVSEQDGATRQG